MKAGTIHQFFSRLKAGTFNGWNLPSGVFFFRTGKRLCEDGQNDSHEVATTIYKDRQLSPLGAQLSLCLY
jgi:hypothetical protein